MPPKRVLRPTVPATQVVKVDSQKGIFSVYYVLICVLDANFIIILIVFFCSVSEKAKKEAIRRNKAATIDALLSEETNETQKLNGIYVYYLNLYLNSGVQFCLLNFSIYRIFRFPQAKKIMGKVAAPHGNKGVLRVIFERGLPGQAIGTKVEIKA